MREISRIYATLSEEGEGKGSLFPDGTIYQICEEAQKRECEKAGKEDHTETGRGRLVLMISKGVADGKS